MSKLDFSHRDDLIVLFRPEELRSIPCDILETYLSLKLVDLAVNLHHEVFSSILDYYEFFNGDLDGKA